MPLLFLLAGAAAWYALRRQQVVDAPPEDVYAVFSRLGGEHGWLYADRLWWLRGVADRQRAIDPALRLGRLCTHACREASRSCRRCIHPKHIAHGIGQPAIYTPVSVVTPWRNCAGRALWL
jgi:hypothetical protein